MEADGGSCRCKEARRSLQLALLYCHTQVFISASCVSVNQAVYVSPAPPTCQPGVLVPRLYGGRLVATRTAEHFNSTQLLLAPFNLLTYINWL